MRRLGRSSTLARMNRKRLGSALSLLAGALVLATLLPETASAQRREWNRDDGIRLDGYLALGFGGEGDVDADVDSVGFNGSFSPDLDPTFGFGARVESAVLPFLSLGGLFEAAAFEADFPDPLDGERKWIFDFDVLARGRWLFEVVRRDLYLEPYVAVPFGFSLGMLPDIDSTDPDDDEVWPGWNIGVLAGLTLLADMGLGGFIEIGWRHHHMHSSFDLPIVGDADIRLATDQFALNMGLAYVF